MDKFLSRLKQRWELYLFFAMGVGAIFLKVWGVGDEVKTIKSDVSEVKYVQEQLAEDKIDGDLLDAKLDPLLASNADLKREVEITRANVQGLRVASLAGAEERAAQLEGRMIVIQNMVYNNTITARAAVESLAVLSREIETVKQLALADTVKLKSVRIDTLRIGKDGRWWNPFD